MRSAFAKAIRRGVCVTILVMALNGAAYADTTASFSSLAAQARVEAHKWHTDAELVQIELLAFGFGMGPSGYPDVNKTGPPGGALFHFRSLSSQQALTVVGDMTHTTVRAQRSSGPTSRYTHAIPPDVSLNFERAITQAKAALGTECAGGDPLTSRSCSVVTGAELHMETDGPTRSSAVWTIRFGQNPRTLRGVSRTVDARTGQVIANKSNEAGTDEATGQIPALRATVTGLRIFVSFQQPTQHQYDDLFFYNAARYIFWELNLVHPPPGRRSSMSIEAIWKGPGGDVIWRAKDDFPVEAESTSSVFWSGARLAGTKTVDIPNQFYEDCRRRQGQPGGPGSCSPTTGVDIQRWQRGDYEVHIVVDKRLVATGSFRMDEKDRIYDEVRAKAADRSSARGFIKQLDAKVTALRFYEADATAASPAKRSYRTQFSLATTRDVSWELDLSHPPPHRWLPLVIEALLFYRDVDGERVVQRKVLQSAAPADWSDTHHNDFFGWENDYYYDRSGARTPSPRRWLPGIYRVDLYVANTKVATGSFEMR